MFPACPLFFLFQVSDQLYLLNKEDAQEHVLTKYMITVHQCLLVSLSADPAGVDSTKLQATRLIEDSTRQWLNKVLEQIAGKVSLKAAAAMKAGLAASDKALSDLKLVPLCDEEINYRNHMRSTLLVWPSRAQSSRQKQSPCPSACKLYKTS